MPSVSTLCPTPAKNDWVTLSLEAKESVIFPDICTAFISRLQPFTSPDLSKGAGYSCTQVGVQAGAWLGCGHFGSLATPFLAVSSRALSAHVSPSSWNLVSFLPMSIHFGAKLQTLSC